MLDDKNTTKRNRNRRSNCMECSHYRPLIFADDGTDAWCGRCTIPTPSGRRLRAVRDAMSPACADFNQRGDGGRDAGAGQA